MSLHPWIRAGLGLGVAAAGDRLLQRWRRREQRELDMVRQALALDPEPDPFALAWVAGLPEPARRYLAHALAPGVQIPASVQLRMIGNIRGEQGGEWLEMEAEELLAPPRGFVWSARLRGRLLSMSVDDHYLAGQGGTRVWLLGRIPLRRTHGPDISRSAAGRLAIEAVLMPAALLPRPDLRWHVGGDLDTARASFKVDTTPVDLTLRLGGDGSLRSATLERWGAPAGGVHDWHVFRVEVFSERTFDGVTIPARLSATWELKGAPPFEFFRAEITRAVFT
ncbi:MAG: hypothetical protein IPK80_15485 [Nannocystis sp.]|nr:hypothetical protein [Nannocystis sp.]